jgi:ubiquitin-like modifier-activating enzyme ATG7
MNKFIVLTRWLPTLLSAIHEKPLINSALGFDSYLVSRFDPGTRTETETESETGIGSGGGSACYFCSDIVAAGNSKMRRPLDEQCTVTR